MIPSSAGWPQEKESKSRARQRTPNLAGPDLDPGLGEGPHRCVTANPPSHNTDLELAEGLDKGHGLDVTDGAAQLDHTDVGRAVPLAIHRHVRHAVDPVLKGWGSAGVLLGPSTAGGLGPGGRNSPEWRP